ncbi:MAG: YciI family protein, partial [Roseiflexaceae bacterium]
NMQFLVYDTNQNPETATPPSPELMAEMGKFIDQATQAGVVVTTGACQPTGARLQLNGGKFSVTDGPFIEAKELTGGFAVIKAESLEEAIEWCKRFRTIIGDGESEIVRIFGPDDFGPA